MKRTTTFDLSTQKHTYKTLNQDRQRIVCLLSSIFFLAPLIQVTVNSG